MGIGGLKSDAAPFSRTGKMPVPQKLIFLVEQAGQPVSTLKTNPQKLNFLVEQAGQPVSTPKTNPQKLNFLVNRPDSLFLLQKQIHKN
ncbi:hypothetical protein [Tychonema sp. LEGE 07203]|uniref:hypothetical protein n=1 Tax=Tychonema sp. LEGE 07203 TaxID=1828671 RepID=UPI00187EBD8F|nr:hypothetical protein [Tychonema sp. LEGE 07203]MBE9094568.1 hypothetical protein [Tychonema sp. LEGE 07203]